MRRQTSILRASLCLVSQALIRTVERDCRPAISSKPGSFITLKPQCRPGCALRRRRQVSNPVLRYHSAVRRAPSANGTSGQRPEQARRAFRRKPETLAEEVQPAANAAAARIPRGGTIALHIFAATSNGHSGTCRERARLPDGRADARHHLVSGEPLRSRRESSSAAAAADDCAPASSASQRSST